MGKACCLWRRWRGGSSASHFPYPAASKLGHRQAGWTMAKNDAWIQGIIESRGTVYVGSPITWNNMYNSVSGEIRPFGREIVQLFNAGYVQQGDYLLPRW